MSEHLKNLSDNTLMVNALEQRFAEELEKRKPKVSAETDNDLLGQKYRAYEEAKEIINYVISEIRAYRNTKVGSSNYNQGK